VRIKCKMKARLIALKLFLEVLSISSDINTVDERKKIQKSIYLGQIAGVDLGYRFGWYLKGPYSPELTKDYYDLDEALIEGDIEYKKKDLNSQLKEKLQAIQPIISPPDDLPLSQEDWLELLASVHYQFSKYDSDIAKTNIKREKENLVPYILRAEEALRKSHLLNN
jgi:uncharacterized protein YwgA